MSPGQRILLIDDDRKLCRLIAEYLEPMGYAVTARHTGPEGVHSALNDSWQAVILDLMLPGMDGFEVLKRIRAETDLPVLMLTARGEEADRIVGLEIGADDYLPKTFSSRELLARLRAVIRRTSRPPAPMAPSTTASDASPAISPNEQVRTGPLYVCQATRTATMHGKPLVLTPVEFALLWCLARARGRVKSREALVDEIRDREYDVFDRSVDVHISALRRKLGDDPKNPRFIRTVRAVGYQMALE